MADFTRIPEAQFITRVELHYAEAKDYANLHKQMKSRGFSQEIIGSDGATYKLPTSEYHYIGSVPGSELLILAEEAAMVVGRAASILVTEAAEISGNGLKPPPL